ncbi:MAG: 4'-phosphopantetheinyl transferase superfamily protein [SAR324 cluster bacterium]|nr:4'-phosphopantetheinyl transferase superfamily protein [SAR324 cluster bacterium]
MLPNPFPDHISFCLLPIHSTSNQKLHPAEENYFSQLSSVSRKEHYRSGRICAGEVLSKLGTLGQPVLRDPQTREPLWPEGISGAITHSGNWAAAAAGKTSDVLGIGIDLEDLERQVDSRISRHVCIPEEQKWLQECGEDFLEQNLKIIFSAKESIFKAFFPYTRTYLHFHDARILMEQTFFQKSKSDSLSKKEKNSKPEKFEFVYLLLNDKVISQTGISEGKGKVHFFENYVLTSLFF